MLRRNLSRAFDIYITEADLIAVYTKYQLSCLSLYDSKVSSFFSYLRFVEKQSDEGKKRFFFLPGKRFNLNSSFKMHSDIILEGIKFSSQLCN